MDSNRILRAVLAALLASTSAFAQAHARVNSTPGAGAPGHAHPPVPETSFAPAPTFSVTAAGADFVQVSATTRTAGFVLTQTCPFAVTVPTLPAGAVVLESFASWNYLTDSMPPTDTIAINGVAVVGNRRGLGTPDLCWGKTGGVTYVASGVTALLNLGAANAIGGACDKTLGADPNALGEGITLTVIYSIPSAAARTVDLWAGYGSTDSSASGLAQARLQLSQPYVGGSTHFLVNALDGQKNAGDNLLINGLPASGALVGTAGPGNAWIGLLGPLPHSNLYDAVEDDLSSFMTAGDLAVDVVSVKLSDCIGHTFAVLAYDASCGSVVSYCTAKLNSLGCTPTLSTAGVPSASTAAAPFIVSASGVLNHKSGVLFYGNASAALAFQGGTLCVAPPVRRLPPKSTGGNPPPSDCSGVLSVDFNQWIAISGDPFLVAGATVYAQVWSRDPGDAFGTSLSDAIAFRICP